MLAWQSLQLRILWTLAACLAGSIEIVLPFADVIPGWPWQARQLSSCLSGWGEVARIVGLAYTSARSDKKQSEKNKTKRMNRNRLTVSAVNRLLFRKVKLPLRNHRYFFNAEGFEEKGP
jgi:hypothetical protein